MIARPSQLVRSLEDVPGTPARLDRSEPRLVSRTHLGAPGLRNETDRARERVGVSRSGEVTTSNADQSAADADTHDRVVLERRSISAAGMPAEQSTDFGATARRLLRRMKPERRRVGTVLTVGVIGTGILVTGPKILGHATDVIVDGVSSSDGIDFGALHRTLAFALTVYAVAAVLSWLQAYLLAGVVQRTMNRLRADVEDKLHALPLPYVDQQRPGDLLSRVTNDIDNVAQSLQQTLSQLVSSTLMLAGVLVMMLTISTLLTVVVVITIPLVLVITKTIARRSQPRFTQQWRRTGILNAQVDEAITGHSLVTAFNRQRDVELRFEAANEEVYRASFAAQFAAGTIQPAMTFLGNLNFVAVAVIGGLQVSAGAMTIGGIQAFMQYSRAYSMPLTQVASMANVLQSGVASAERVFELLDADEQSPDPDVLDAPRSAGRTGGDSGLAGAGGSGSTTSRSPTIVTSRSSRTSR